MGVELDRKRAREEESGRRESTAARVRRRGEGCRRRQEQRSYERRDLGQVEAGGRSEWFWSREKGETVSSCPPGAPKTCGISRRCGWESCSKSWERWRRRWCLTEVLQANSTGRPLWLGGRERERKREGEKTKGDTTLEAVDMATFLNSKLESRLCIWSHLSIQERRSVRTLFGCSRGLKSACGVVPHRVEIIFEDSTATDHSLFFLSFELESFLNKGCFHWGFQWRMLV